MKPNINTEFKNLSEIEKYTDGRKYYCTNIVFSPETEGCFEGCPSYIEINEVDDDYNEERTLYFKIPQIIAYYADVHQGYTEKGIKDYIQKGKDDLRWEIKRMLKIN